MDNRVHFWFHWRMRNICSRDTKQPKIALLALEMVYQNNNSHNESFENVYETREINTNGLVKRLSRVTVLSWLKMVNKSLWASSSYSCRLFYQNNSLSFCDHQVSHKYYSGCVPLQKRILINCTNYSSYFHWVKNAVSTFLLLFQIVAALKIVIRTVSFTNKDGEYFSGIRSALY